MKVGRVIARPFVGEPGHFRRTAQPARLCHRAARRRPCCDWVQGAGRATHAIGKIGDIFSMQGIGDAAQGQTDAELFEHLLALADSAEPVP